MTAGDQVTSAKWATGRVNKNNLSLSKLPLRVQYRIATWNIRGLLQAGKLFILEQELIKQNIDICGIAETHWKDRGHFEGTEYKIFISGAEKTGQRGVAILVSKKLARSVYEYLPINDRLIMITFNAKPTKLHIFQVYMPTTDADDDEVEEVYKVLEEKISKIPRKHIVIVMGDWNAKVGETLNDDNLRETVGEYGLGERNARGERLIQFSVDNEFTITNTNFKKHPRRLSTWTSPGARYKNQIDYILVRKRWKTSVKDVETRTSAEGGSDHKLLRAEFKIKFHGISKPMSTTRVVPEDLAKFQSALKNSIKPKATGDPEKTWIDTKQWILNAIDSTNSKKQLQRRKHWMSDETMELVDLGRADWICPWKGHP
ncbi:craniofacial development protein 2-like [Harmonia axyridis]|uniref:craniofacial development protein 2-like n=1 Tax=Harmonia axyridis TaxID=115357 RepID=UPI001E279C21|nr:craniofacial development protein 2-like [Harmonia axyridis]